MTLPYFAKEATGIAKTFVSASISVLLSALPAYMLLILKNIVKKIFGLVGDSLSLRHSLLMLWLLLMLLLKPLVVWLSVLAFGFLNIWLKYASNVP